jgi:hypothetical protein
MDRKTLYTLNIGNFAPTVTEITYPLMRHYARKIGADFVIITERKFPGYPIPYEKLQIYELAQERKDSWVYYIDADAMIHPEAIDFTNYIPKDTVAHNGQDFAAVRWKYDKYFLRDGRSIGSCNWLAIASEWCLDLWKPLDDLTLEEAVANINITVAESRSGVIDREHLLDDYTLSRNIAKYGLKHTTIKAMSQRVFGQELAFFWHAYVLPVADKTAQMRRVVKRIMDKDGQPNGWGIRDVLRDLSPVELDWLDEPDDSGPIDGQTRECQWKPAELVELVEAA